MASRDWGVDPITLQDIMHMEDINMLNNQDGENRMLQPPIISPDIARGDPSVSSTVVYIEDMDALENRNTANGTLQPFVSCSRTPEPTPDLTSETLEEFPPLQTSDELFALVEGVGETCPAPAEESARRKTEAGAAAVQQYHRSMSTNTAFTLRRLTWERENRASLTESSSDMEAEMRCLRVSLTMARRKITLLNATVANLTDTNMQLRGRATKLEIEHAEAKEANIKLREERVKWASWSGQAGSVCSPIPFNENTREDENDLELGLDTGVSSSEDLAEGGEMGMEEDNKGRLAEVDSLQRQLQFVREGNEFLRMRVIELTRQAQEKGLNISAQESDMAYKTGAGGDDNAAEKCMAETLYWTFGGCIVLLASLRFLKVL